MHRISLLLLALLLAAALPAAAQTTPRPPADTLRFGATRPATGDSIAMAEYGEEGEDAASSDETSMDEEGAAEEDTVPGRSRSGPYARAGGTGPFSVQASGQTAARAPRSEVVWVQGRAPRAAAADSARRDTARAGTGQRVASGQTTRRDTASTAATTRPPRGDTASAAANRPARRDTASATASRPAPRDTVTIRRNGSTTATASGSNAGRTGSTTTATAGSSGRAGESSSARATSHTVASGETFYGIARRYGVTAAQLRAVNPDVEMDALEVGDVLRLPASARDSRAGSSPGSQRTGAQTPPRTGTQSGGSQAQRRTHTVAAGETLFGIARRYGVTVDAIRAANDMQGDQVRTGQRLVIPPAR